MSLMEAIAEVWKRYNHLRSGNFKVVVRVNNPPIALVALNRVDTPCPGKDDVSTSEPASGNTVCLIGKNDWLKGVEVLIAFPYHGGQQIGVHLVQPPSSLICVAEQPPSVFW